MKIRTLLVDSSYLLERSFNGAKDVYTNSYGHIGGLYSFLTTVRKLIKEHKINKVVLLWDGENSGVARHHLDPAYKANRKYKSWYEKIEMTEAEVCREKKKRDSILNEKVSIQNYAEELFLRQIKIDDIEADDLIAAYCMAYDTKEEIYIYTNDRDFGQLLDLNITILFANIELPVNKTNYFFKFGHHYSNAIIMKIIGGDVSDNIKGIKGIKEDILLKYFPEMKYKHLTVREICRKADEINKERIANNQKPLKIFENLLGNIDRLILNYRLVNLRKPFLNEQDRKELEQLKLPLDPKDRGINNLHKMMMKDEFLTIYNGTFPNYVEPFYTVITNEQDLYKEYNRKSKVNL